MTPQRPRAALPVALATAVLAAAAWLGACTVDRSRSPVCGMALLVGPNLILQQLSDARTLLTHAPRGLPGTLPVRITGQPDTGRAAVGADLGGVLLVDDSTAVVYGVLVYERPRPPSDYPRVGTLSDPRRAIPIYGLRVN